MPLGYMLFILSGIIILMGSIGIMMMFMTSTDHVINMKTMFIAMGIGLLITCFNLITFPPHAYLARGVTTFTGILAIFGFICNKKDRTLIAKFIISFSIIFGLAQLILIY